MPSCEQGNDIGGMLTSLLKQSPKKGCDYVFIAVSIVALTARCMVIKCCVKLLYYVYYTGCNRMRYTHFKIYCD